jgi:hypothetical protein
MNRLIFLPKRQGETPNYEFDFLSSLAIGETISTQVVTAEVFTGVDPSPPSIIGGSASASGSIVSQKITAGVVGVVYNLVCTITTSTGQTLQLAAFLYVEPTLS